MRTAQLVEPGRFSVRAADAPSGAGPGDVIVRVRGCGLCASNLGPWSGVKGISYPLDAGAPGHEIYGTVEEVGTGVDGLSVGDPVTTLSYNGFADYDVAPADTVVRLPESLSESPVLGEPLACAVNVFRRAGVREGDVVVVMGIGFLGALLLRLLRRAEPSRIIAVSRRAKSLEVAERMGADELLTYDDDVVGRIGELTGGHLADVVIEATGKAGPLDRAAEATRVRGRLVVAGYHQDGPRSVNMQLWNWRGIDVVNAHERDADVYIDGMREAVRMLAEGRLDLDPLLTHFIPLGEINHAFGLAKERPDGFFKAVVVPEEAE